MRSARPSAHWWIGRCIVLTLGGVLAAPADVGAPIVGFTSEGNGPITLVTNQAGTNGTLLGLGHSLATCDFNGDGFADLAIGVPNEDVGTAVDAGAVRVLYGSPRGLATADNQLWDQNTPGIDGTAATGDHFGAALAAGDFNGDGFCDLAIGVPDEDLGTIVDGGAVHILYGSPSGLSAVNNQAWDQNKQDVQGFAAAGDRFGAALAAGDFDGDGFPDLAIGVPGHDIGTAVDAGDVNILYGGPRGLSAARNQLWSQRSRGVQGLAERGDHFGAALAAGDFDHDGFVDLAVGVPDEDLGSIVDAGAVNVLFGGPHGLSALRNQFWNQSRNLQGAAERGDHFGAALAAGDFDHDGFADLAVGVPGEDVGTVVDAGAVNVLYGARHGLTFTGTQFWEQNRPGVLDASERGDRFGSALTAGDFNGDGFTDLAIGVPGEDVGPIVDAGAVNVLYGGAHGLSAADNQLWTQDSPGVEGAAAAGDAFGAALAAGDFNGDGFADLAIGVPGEDVGAIVDAGAVNVLYGGRLGLSAAGSQRFDENQLQAGPPPTTTTTTTPRLSTTTTTTRTTSTTTTCPTPDMQTGCGADQVCNARRQCQALSDFCFDPTPPLRVGTKGCAAGDPAKQGDPCTRNADCDGPPPAAGNGRCNPAGHRGQKRPLEGGWDANNALSNAVCSAGDPAKIGNACANNANCDGPPPAVGNGRCPTKCRFGDPAKIGKGCTVDADCDGPPPAVGNGTCGEFGTLGSLPLLGATARRLLSNNHVFSRESGNNGTTAAGGENINQPHLSPAVAKLSSPPDAYELDCHAGGGPCGPGQGAFINAVGRNCLDAAIGTPNAGLEVSGGILDVSGGPAPLAPSARLVCAAGDPNKVGTTCAADANCDGPVPNAGNGRCRSLPTVCAGSSDPGKLGMACAGNTRAGNGACDGPAPTVGNGRCRPGCPASASPNLLNLIVKKSGARTGLTCGTITHFNDAFTIGNVAYVGQITIAPRAPFGFKNRYFSCAGDSGSLVLGVATNRPIGLLFADNSKSCTATGAVQTNANPIELVLGRFGLHY